MAKEEYHGDPIDPGVTILAGDDGHDYRSPDEAMGEDIGGRPAALPGIEV
jgi:hypothetical protein